VIGCVGAPYHEPRP